MERRKAVSQDLRYVARTLARQAELSQQTLTLLAESSSTVNLTDEEFRGIGGLLNQSKVILAKYGRREVTDKILIFMALIFFYSCVIYVISKRTIRNTGIDMKQVRKFTKIFVKLPNCLMSDYIILPTISLQQGDTKDCRFEWYRQITPQERDLLSESGKADQIVREDRVLWYKLSESLTYKPTIEDVARRLRLVCWSTDGVNESPKYRAISKRPVEIGPGECPFERRHQHTKDKLNSPDEFRIVTYNILADMYADSDYSRSVLFAHCPAHALEIDYRRQLLLKEILGYNADIVCLQEVDKKEFIRVYEPFLRELANLIGLYDGKRGHGQEGVATFYRQDKFQLINSHKTLLTDLLRPDDQSNCEDTEARTEGDKSGGDVKVSAPERPHPIFDSSDQTLIEDCFARFDDIKRIVVSNPNLKGRFAERNTVLQTSLLKISNLDRSFIIVANTHFYFAPDADHIRLLQGCICAKYLEHIKEFYRLLIRRTLNIDEPLINIVFCGDLNSSPDCGTYALLTKGKVSQQALDWSSNDEEVGTVSDIGTSLRFSSAYEGIEYTNYTPDFKGCLDYIYFERDGLKCDSTVPLPCHEDVTATGGIPSEVFPSDHLALVANLRITNK